MSGFYTILLFRGGVAEFETDLFLPTGLFYFGGDLLLRGGVLDEETDFCLCFLGGLLD